MNNGATISQTVLDLREHAQDFEFYPTTDAIISAMVRDLKSREDYEYGGRYSSVLDIGAGNGKVLLALRAQTSLRELHAIEKSTLLCQQLHEDILIVGTEFEEQSLLSKSVDVVFCNPPYSDFEPWAEKIIRQADAQLVYLVIPARWESSAVIADALRFREATAHKAGEFDFLEAERAARAKVHLLRVDLHRMRHGEGTTAFERFFQEQFADLIAKFGGARSTGQDEHEEKKERGFSSLVVGPNYPAALVNLYQQEMAHVERNYALVAELDVDLLREFEISPPRIMACLKTRLEGLRSLYWHELFAHLSTVTDRLTAGSRKSLLETLHRHVQVDFTVSNICAVIIWVIKNANRFIDSQLVSTYELMVDKCNVHLYKSNQRTWVDDRWRYQSDAPRNTHFALDYRIVTHRIGGVKTGYSWEKGLEDRAATFLGDLHTLAKNLGFHCRTVHSSLDHHGRAEWEPGARRIFYYNDAAGRERMLFDVRAFKNGNLHLRLNQSFILALNVEHGRLQGWLRSASEAVEELKDPGAADYFKINAQLAITNPALMLAGSTNLV